MCLITMPPGLEGFSSSTSFIRPMKWWLGKSQRWSLCDALFSRRRALKWSVLSPCQPWSWQSRSLCWTTSFSEAFLMSEYHGLSPNSVIHAAAPSSPRMVASFWKSCWSFSAKLYSLEASLNQRSSFQWCFCLIIEEMSQRILSSRGPPETMGVMCAAFLRSMTASPVRHLCV